MPDLGRGCFDVWLPGKFGVKRNARVYLAGGTPVFYTEESESSDPLAGLGSGSFDVRLSGKFGVKHDARVFADTLRIDNGRANSLYGGCLLYTSRCV